MEICLDASHADDRKENIGYLRLYKVILSGTHVFFTSIGKQASEFSFWFEI